MLKSFTQLKNFQELKKQARVGGLGTSGNEKLKAEQQTAQLTNEELATE